MGGFAGFGSTPSKTKEGGSDVPNAPSQGFGTTPTAGFGAPGGFGTSPAAEVTATTNPPSDPSSPFGPRIPRKIPKKDTATSNEWVRGGTTGQESSHTEAAGSGAAAGDEKLAALRARIQEKQKLLKLKQQSKQSNGEAGRGNISPTRLRGGELATTKEKKDDATSNAELAAKNALRFSTSNTDRDLALNKLLPSDLKVQSSNNQSSSNTDGSGGWSTPVDSGEEDDGMDGRNLSNAKSLVGICRSMCPDEELIRREKEGDIQLLEVRARLYCKSQALKIIITLR